MWRAVLGSRGQCICSPQWVLSLWSDKVKISMATSYAPNWNNYPFVIIWWLFHFTILDKSRWNLTLRFNPTWLLYIWTMTAMMYVKFRVCLGRKGELYSQNWFGLLIGWIWHGCWFVPQNILLHIFRPRTIDKSTLHVPVLFFCVCVCVGVKGVWKDIWTATIY